MAVSHDCPPALCVLVCAGRLCLFFSKAWSESISFNTEADAQQIVKFNYTVFKEKVACYSADSHF